MLQSSRPGGIAALDRLATQSAQRLNELIDEVHAIGCELKDWETGLIDFRTIHDGREVYLCWRLGEESIRFWHELNAGSIGRHAIDIAFKEANVESGNP